MYATTALAPYGPAGAVLLMLMAGVADAEFEQVESAAAQLEGAVQAVLLLHTGGVQDGPVQPGGGVM